MVTKKPRVVIIGAGMAGLTAAHRLHTAHSADLFDLCVIEASNRTGGRILTAEFAGNRVEMGATWIHGIGGSPIYAIAEDINALTDDSHAWERMDGFPCNPVTVAEGGVLVDNSLVVKPITLRYRQLMDAARDGEAIIDEKNPGVGLFLEQGLKEYQANRDQSIGSNNNRYWSLEALEEAVFSIHENVERVCTSADDLKDLNLAAESEYRDYPGDQITIAKGYSSIIQHLAAALPPDMISFGRRVHCIEWCSNGLKDGSYSPVKLYFNDDDKQVMTADHVIVTVSLGVLKAGVNKDKGEKACGLEFTPLLPLTKREAIGRLGFGLVNKLFIELESNDTSFPFLQMAFAKQPLETTKIPEWIRRTASICPIYNGSRVLLSWLVGNEALELEKLTDDEITKGINATLNSFYHSVLTEDGQCNGKDSRKNYAKILRVMRSMWGYDPLFLGSYSYVSVGSSGDDLDVIADPLPSCKDHSDDEHTSPPLQILFAGEATHRTHYSTTHGAYLSGIREANRLIKHYHCDNGEVTLV